MHKICLIAFYIGKLPDYFPYFISSCEHNPTIDFLVFNDTFTRVQKKNNINLIPLSMLDFNRTASEKLNLSINIQTGWKINELKPAFGVIFNDRLTSYDFWGWCDIDVIWGNMRNFLTNELLTKYDVITFKEKWTAGHFTLFKNISPFNKLYEFSPSYKKIFLSEKYTAFEESCKRWNGDFHTIDFLIKNNLLVSMYDIVKNLNRENKLNAYFKDVIREYPQPISYIYKQSSWYDLNKNEEEFMYYHLLTVKKIWRFYIPLWKIIPESFLITQNGFKKVYETKGLPALLWRIKRFFSCLPKIIKSIKKQNINIVIKKLICEVNKLTPKR